VAVRLADNHRPRLRRQPEDAVRDLCHPAALVVGPPAAWAVIHLGTIRLTYPIQDVESGRDRPATEPIDEIEITPEMIEAGESVILSEVGGADLGGWFSASDLAVRVFLAMRALDNVSKLNQLDEHNQLK